MTVTHKLILHRLGITSDLDETKRICSISPNNATVLACSVFKPDASVDRIISASDSGRKLLADKKQPFEQFKPKSLVKSVSQLHGVEMKYVFIWFLSH